MDCKPDESLPSYLILSPLFCSLSMDMGVYSMMLRLGEDVAGGRKAGFYWMHVKLFGSFSLLGSDLTMRAVKSLTFLLASGLGLNLC